MVCGRVKRTNALQKWSTASSGVVPLLRNKPPQCSETVQLHAA